MYIPKYFKPSDMDEVRTFLSDARFAILVQVEDGRPVATHLPVEYCTDAEGDYVLAHMARANRQWRLFASSDSAMMIFQGPDAYISPAWYDHVNVPTWNYQAVHIHGRASLIEDREEVLGILSRLMRRHESARECPVRFENYTASFLENEIRGTVAFRVDVESIEANYKLSQNRNEQDYARIIDELKAVGGENELGVASAMQRIGKTRDKQS